MVLLVATAFADAIYITSFTCSHLILTLNHLLEIYIIR